MGDANTPVPQMFKRYFDFNDLHFRARVVILLIWIRVVFYKLFCRYSAFSIQKLRSCYPIRAYPGRVFIKAQDMLSLLDH
jgi:hypothetical protein